MSGALDRFTEAARALGLHPEPRRFPEGTKTADDAARAVGCDVGQIVKSLVFAADGAPVLVRGRRHARLRDLEQGHYSISS